MNVKIAIKILREHGYKIISHDSEKKWSIAYNGFCLDEKLSGREIIKMARIYTSDNNQNTAMKRSLKHFRNRKNRSKTREDLSHDRFDNFDKNKLRQDDDSWNWD